MKGLEGLKDLLNLGPLSDIYVLETARRKHTASGQLLLRIPAQSFQLSHSITDERRPLLASAPS